MFFRKFKVKGENHNDDSKTKLLLFALYSHISVFDFFISPLKPIPPQKNNGGVVLPPSRHSLRTSLAF
jgi:hypothetical protein